MRRYLLPILLTLSPCVLAAPPAPFAGHYGHNMAASAEDVVWTVQEAGTQWRVVLATDGKTADAQRLHAHGREAFWARMHWPKDTSAEADCLSWGEKPGSLEDLLADTPPAASSEDYGYALLCHVPQATRVRIDWIAGNSGDWFYYDPLMGVIEAHRLH